MITLNEVAAGTPRDLMRSFLVRLEATPFYTRGFTIWGVNDKDFGVNINEPLKILEFPRSVMQQYRDAWGIIRRSLPVEIGPFPPDSKATAKETIVRLQEVIKLTEPALPTVDTPNSGILDMKPKTDARATPGAKPRSRLFGWILGAVGVGIVVAVGVAAAKKGG